MTSSRPHAPVGKKPLLQSCPHGLCTAPCYAPIAQRIPLLRRHFARSERLKDYTSGIGQVKSAAGFFGPCPSCILSAFPSLSRRIIRSGAKRRLGHYYVGSPRCRIQGVEPCNIGSRTQSARAATTTYWGFSEPCSAPTHRSMCDSPVEETRLGTPVLEAVRGGGCVPLWASLARRHCGRNQSNCGGLDPEGSPASAG